MTESSEVYYQLAALFRVSAASLAAFVIIENKVESPLLDLKLMKNKCIHVGYALGVERLKQ